MADFEKKALVVGISGASSSGKSTISRLLRDIFPNSFVLHADDFYKPENELPIKDGLLDWDCAESLSITDMVSTLEYIQKHADFPPDFGSKEDRNPVGKCPVHDAVIASLKARVTQWTEPGQPGHGILSTSPAAVKLCILDGFLLYSESMKAVQPHIDIKIFLRVSYAKAKARREARSGYATLEGWWEDPPGYVDKIVWPNYVQDHKWMFENGDVEGKFKVGLLQDWKILCQTDQNPDVDFEVTLNWVVETVMIQLENLARDS